MPQKLHYENNFGNVRGAESADECAPGSSEYFIYLYLHGRSAQLSRSRMARGAASKSELPYEAIIFVITAQYMLRLCA